VTAIELLIVLRACKDRLASIDHNDVIAHIHERRPCRDCSCRRSSELPP
jgi:hypothetical protein